MHVNGWLDVGGIEEVLLTTAKFNLREKYDLAFVSYRRNDGYAGLELQKLGYPVYGLNLTSAMYDIRVITSLVKLFKEYKPQIVHFYQKSSFIGRIAAKIAGIPVILCNEMDLNYNHVGMIAVFTKYLRKMPNVITDKVIVCSNAVRNYWDGKNSPKYMVIHVPFDSSKTLPETLYFAGKQKKGFFKKAEFWAKRILSRGRLSVPDTARVSILKPARRPVCRRWPSWKHSKSKSKTAMC